MKQKERLEIIIEELERNGQIKVAELAQKLDISQVTIRNDIRKLDQEGILKKTYGGAVKKNEGLYTKFEPGNFFLNGRKKQRIAKKAFSHIMDGDSVMLDDSTSSCYLASEISSHPEKSVIVVTNSVYVAATLSSCAHVELYLLGGRVASSPPSVMDPVAIDNIGTYHVSKLFTGIHGIDLAAGLNSMDMIHMEMKKKMIECAEEVYVMADQSKFGRSGLFTVCPLSEVRCIITDSDIQDDILVVLRELKVDVEIV